MGELVEITVALVALGLGLKWREGVEQPGGVHLAGSGEGLVADVGASSEVPVGENAGRQPPEVERALPDAFGGDFLDRGEKPGDGFLAVCVVGEAEPAVDAGGAGSQGAVVGAQVEGVDSMIRAMKGDVTPVNPVASLADGVRVKVPGFITRRLCAQLLDDVVTVREAELRETLVRLALEENLIAEGAGALALAAGRRVAGKRKCAVVSGGNIDATVLAQLLSDVRPRPPRKPRRRTVEGEPSLAGGRDASRTATPKSPAKTGVRRIPGAALQTDVHEESIW